MGELGDLFGGVGSAIGGTAVLLGAAGEGGDKYFKQAVQVFEKLKDPDYDMSTIPPAELKIFAKYFPEAYKVMVPENIKQVVESPDLRLSELRTMKAYEKMGQEGLSTSTRLAEQEATRSVAAEAARAQEGAMRDVAARGRLGTTDELVARMLANSQASELARAQGSDLATRQEAARREGLQGAASMASGIRGEDYQVGAKNADIMNRLAEYIANEQTASNQWAAASRERAGTANTEQQQRVGETNILNKYNTAVENLDRQNRLKGLLAEYQLSKAQGLAGALGGVGQSQDRTQAARAANLQMLGTQAGRAVGSLGDIAIPSGGSSQTPKTKTVYTF